jgi:transmembrane sensor
MRSSESAGAGRQLTDAEWESLDRALASESSLDRQANATAVPVHAALERFAHAPLDVAQFRAGLWERIETEATVVELGNRRLERRRLFGSAYRTIGARATMAIATLGVFAAAWVLSTEQRSVRAPTMKRYTTGAGERATLRLSDGSVITVAPMTSLDVTRTSKGTEIALRGEAYFQVVPTTRTTFVVTTADVTTRVLGTAFGVRRYATDRDVRVIVTEGRVVTGRGRSGKLVTLAAGDIARIGDSVATVIQHVNGDEQLGWRTGRLAFRDVPVSELLDAVGRWYGYDFRVTDTTLIHQRVTTTLDGKSAQTVLRALGVLLDARMVFGPPQEGRTIVTLHANAAHRSPAPMRKSERDGSPFHSKEFGR